MSITIKKSKLIFLLLVSLFSTLIFQTTVNAEEDPMGFSYQPVFPENQMDGKLGYYKLKMKPNQEQTVVIKLMNGGKEKVKIDVALNGAKTNSNGVIEYGPTKLKEDPSLKYKFTDVVTGPKTVEVASGQSKDLELKIKMPAEGYDGVISGGIQLMKQDEGQKTKADGGASIVNKYAYIIGMLLQTNDTKVTPDLKFNSVKAGQSNYRNAILVNYSNVKAEYLNDMSTDVKIHKKGETKNLYETKNTGMRMAPNSFIDFPVSLEGDEMKAGTYVADILVVSKDQSWKWSEEFVIDKATADKYNERDVTIVQNKGINWKMIALIVGAFLVVLIIIAFIIRKKKQTTDEDE